MTRRIRAISPDRFEKLIAKLGLTQRGAARFLGIDERTSRRMVRGEAAVEPPTAMLLELMVKHHISTDDALRAIGVSPRAAAKAAKPFAAPRYYNHRKGAS